MEGFKWQAEQRAEAKKQGKTLFAVGIDSKKAVAGMRGVIEHEKAVGIFQFARLMYEGKTPQQALDEAFGVTNPKPPTPPTITPKKKAVKSAPAGDAF